jgi:hypothetical protein
MFPLLTLPPLTPRDTLVLASGPSFDDFAVAELQNCGAVLYGCGHVSDLVRLDHYALGDWPAHHAHLPRDPATRIHVTETVLDSAREAGFPELDRLEVIDKHRIHTGSAGNMTLSLAAQSGHERVFVLGFDGLSDSRCRFRRRAHARQLDSDEPVRWDRREAIDDSELLQIEVARQLTRDGRRVPIYSLTPHSVLPLPCAPEVEAQPFSHIDRNGQLLIGVAPPGRIDAYLDLVRYWRRCHPRLAIMVFLSADDRVPRDAPADVLYRWHFPTHAEVAGFTRVEIVSTFGEH